MTEKEKMLRGEIYNANYDKELLAEREACKELCYDYNNLRPTQYKEREELLRKLLGSCKNNFTMEQSVWFDYGYNISIGENFFSMFQFLDLALNL